jgi:adenosine deaminase
LHLHLDGAIRERTLREECVQLGIGIPSIPSEEVYPSFTAFMTSIEACHEALSSPDSLRRIVGEIVEDAAGDGAVWVELSLWPGLFKGRLGTQHDALAMVIDAGRSAGDQFGVGFGVMVAANRNEGPASAEQAASVAAGLAGDGVVSFGLDGDEQASPAAAFRRAFHIARAAGLLSTPHAGEQMGPGSVTSAMDDLGADRLLHGVRSIEDPRLVQRLAESGTCLDVCPTSNLRLGIYTPASHPLRDLLGAGVRCSINADDPLLFGTSLLHEYELSRSRFALSDTQLADVAATSIRASGAPPELKIETVAHINRWVERPEP